MSYRADKQVIDTHTDTHTDRYTDRGDDNTRGLKLASGKNGSTPYWLNEDLTVSMGRSSLNNLKTYINMNKYINTYK